MDHKESGGSLTRKPKGGAPPPVPNRTRQDIEIETKELNQNANDVQKAYSKLRVLWQQQKVPMQHQVAFVESIKVLDMTMMAQIFNKEVQDF